MSAPTKTPLLIDQQLLTTVSQEGRWNPRRRKNLNFHEDDAAVAHRLLNAIEPGPYLPPHRHPDANKDETTVALRGRHGVVFFEALGTVQETVLIGADGRRLPHGKRPGVSGDDDRWGDEVRIV